MLLALIIYMYLKKFHKYLFVFRRKYVDKLKYAIFDIAIPFDIIIINDFFKCFTL